jgi:hypothetical protein
MEKGETPTSIISRFLLVDDYGIDHVMRDHYCFRRRRRKKRTISQLDHCESCDSTIPDWSFFLLDLAPLATS